jgi:uncharacterized protein (DUF362 family)
LTDGIVAGEGNGPLAARPVPLGAVTFSSCLPFADMAHSALMRFDWRRIPLVRQAFGPMGLPLAESCPAALVVMCGGKSWTAPQIAARFGRQFRAADGWRGDVELR